MRRSSRAIFTRRLLHSYARVLAPCRPSLMRLLPNWSWRMCTCARRWRLAGAPRRSKKRVADDKHLLIVCHSLLIHMHSLNKSRMNWVSEGQFIAITHFPHRLRLIVTVWQWRFHAVDMRIADVMKQINDEVVRCLCGRKLKRRS